MTEVLTRSSEVNEKGRLPEPTYLIDESGLERIGIQRTDANGEITNFYFWHNIEGGDLTDESFRHTIAANIARYKVIYGVNAAVGKPFLLDACDPLNKIVVLDPSQDAQALYIQADHEKMFQFALSASMASDEEILDPEQQENFWEVFYKTVENLPYR